jgi:hypothetical protein
VAPISTDNRPTASQENGMTVTCTFDVFAGLDGFAAVGTT